MSAISRPKKIIFSSLVPVLVLAAMEIVLRVHDFSFYVNVSADILGLPLLDMTRMRRVANRTVEFDPVLFWRFKPSQVLSDPKVYRKPVHINSHGFRGPEASVAKPAGVYRIACLGDSSTFGWSVGDDETFAWYLQELLHAEFPAGRFEVLNFGVTGYSSYQGRELMARVVREYQPDVVLFAFGANDRWPALHSDEEHSRAKTWEVSGVQLFLRRLQIYQLLRAGVVYGQNRLAGRSLNPGTYIAQLKRKVNQDEFSRNVKDVSRMCRECGAKLILLNLDFPAQPRDPADDVMHREAAKAGVPIPADWRFWDSSAVTGELAREMGVPGLDARPLFEEKLKEIGSGAYPERSRAMEQQLGDKLRQEPWRYLMIDDGHPNAWGHRIIAEALKDKILTLDAFPMRNKERER